MRELAAMSLPLLLTFSAPHILVNPVSGGTALQFSLLPLHAAAPYRKDQQNLADLYISSYMPTLSALIRARTHHPWNLTTERKHSTAIGLANAIGTSELLSVDTELANIGQCVEVKNHALPRSQKS